MPRSQAEWHRRTELSVHAITLRLEHHLSTEIVAGISESMHLFMRSAYLGEPSLRQCVSWRTIYRIGNLHLSVSCHRDACLEDVTLINEFAEINGTMRSPRNECCLSPLREALRDLQTSWLSQHGTPVVRHQEYYAETIRYMLI